jgi:hypothetical protein
VLPIGVRARVRVREVLVPSLVGGVGWGLPPVSPKVSNSTLLGENASTSPKMVEKITTAAATADLLGVLSTQIFLHPQPDLSTVVKITDMDPDQTSSPVLQMEAKLRRRRLLI